MRDRISDTAAVLRMLGTLVTDRGGAWWDGFFADRAKPCPFFTGRPDENLAGWFGAGCFHHLPPHRRGEYAALVRRALRPGGSYGLACFRPEGGSGHTDQQVYERASLGGGLGYSADRLCALWDRPPFGVRVPRQMSKACGQGPYFGEDFLRVLLATKAGAG